MGRLYKTGENQCFVDKEYDSNLDCSFQILNLDSASLSCLFEPHEPDKSFRGHTTCWCNFFVVKNGQFLTWWSLKQNNKSITDNSVGVRFKIESKKLAQFRSLARQSREKSENTINLCLPLISLIVLILSLIDYRRQTGSTNLGDNFCRGLQWQLRKLPQTDWFISKSLLLVFY